MNRRHSKGKRILAVITASLVFVSSACTTFAKTDEDKITDPVGSEDLFLSEEVIESEEAIESGKSTETMEAVETEKKAESKEAEETGPSPETEVTDEIKESEGVEATTGSDELESEDPESEDDPEVSGPFATGFVMPDDYRSPDKVDHAGDELYAEIPNRYVDKDFLDSVPLSDQNPYGTCWAFATIGLAEFSLQKQGKLKGRDLSELHLAYFSNNSELDPLGGTVGDRSYFRQNEMLMEGGNYDLSSDALAAWIGAADENVVPYSLAEEVNSGGSLDGDLCYEDIAHLRSYYRLNLSDTGEVKKCIMNYGGVGVTFKATSGYSAYYDPNYYKPSTNSYYCPVSLMPNHTVMVVGWDDDYKASNFNIQPPGNGAWLVRNSWTGGKYSTTKSYAGYFWMSYYEASLIDEAVVFDFDDKDTVDNNYQYDGGVRNTSWANGKKGANIFTAHSDGPGDERLDAVMVYSWNACNGYTVKIYKDLKNSTNPESGTLVSTTTGELPYEGYHTIVLDEPVTLKKNEKFSVVVSLDIDYSLAMEMDQDSVNPSYDASSSAGESFVYNEYSRSWDDIGKQGNGNVRIKAFTKDVMPENEIKPEQILFDDDLTQNGKTLNKEDSFTPGYSVLPEDTTDKRVSWSSSNEAVATVDKKGKVTGVSAGNAVITATSKADSSISASFSVTVTKDLKGIKITGLPDSLICGKEYRLEVEAVPKGAVLPDEVTWESSKPEMIKVDSAGRAMVKECGSATITATCGSLSTTADVVIIPATPRITAKKESGTSVLLSFDAVQGAIIYDVYRTVGYERSLITQIVDTLQNSYQYTDYLSNVTEGKPVIYSVVGRSIDDICSGESTVTIFFGKTYKITYHPGKGETPPDNPREYPDSGSVGLKTPIAPEGYSSKLWYTQKTQKIGGIVYTSITYTDSVPINSEYGDYDLYATYVPNIYRIRFYPNGGTGTMKTINATYDKAVTLTANSFVKAGYSFDGWNTEPDGTGRAFKNKESVKNLTSEQSADIRLYAQWAGKQFSLKLDANGGHIISGTKKLTTQTISAASGGKYHDLSTPEKTGYHFDGWFTEKSGGTKVVNGDDVISDVTVLYARFSPISSKVTFDVSYETINESVPGFVEVVYDGTYGPLPVITSKLGHTFVGWFLEKECVNEVTKDSPVKTTEDHVLYAGWFKTPYVSAPDISIDGYDYYDGTFPVPEGSRIRISCFTNGTKIRYTTDGSTPDGSSPLYAGTLSAYENGQDKTYIMTIKAFAQKDGYNDSPVSEQIVKVVPAHIWESDLDRPENAADKAYYEAAGKPAGAWIAGLDPDGYDYTGDNVKPGIRVYYGKKLLVSKEEAASLGIKNYDYSVAYKNNKNAYIYAENQIIDGKGFQASKAPTVTVTLTGNYKGKVTGYFKINRIKLSDTRIKIPDITLAYNGKVQKGTTKITYTTVGGKVNSLRAGSDFTYFYPHTDSKKGDYDPDAFKASDETYPWIVTVMAKENGNYEGSATFNETITGKKLISKASVSKIPDQQYSGNPITVDDKVVVKYSGVKTPLAEHTDYELEYADNTEVGTASVTIKGIGEYTGELVKTFKITGTPMSKVTFPSDFSGSAIITSDNFDAKSKKFIYSGQPFEAAGPADPSSTEDYGIKLVYKYKEDGINKQKTLEKGKDYTVSYDKNVNAGSATVIFTGKGGYTGSVKKTFGIIAYTSSDKAPGRLSVSGISRAKYVSGGTCPEPVVMDGEKVLVKGKDYTVKYSNNNKVNDLSAADEKSMKKWPMVTITLKGNYKGTLTNIFAIERTDIWDMTINVADRVFTAKKGNCATTFTVTDVNGKNLKSGTDFEKQVDITYHSDTKLANGSLRKANYPVYKDDIVPAGTILDVTVTGKGNYQMTLKGSYRMIAADIGKASVSSVKKRYTGSAVYLSEEDIVLTMTVGREKVKLQPGDYYIAGYENNIQKGTAKATVVGTGNYGGKKVISFTIEPAQAAVTN